MPPHLEGLVTNPAADEGGLLPSGPAGRPGPTSETVPGGAEVRVLRAGVDGGSSGSGDLAGAAAGPGGGAGRRVRADRRGLLRRGAEPDPAVGAPSEGGGARSGYGRPGPRL